MNNIYIKQATEHVRNLSREKSRLVLVLSSFIFARILLIVNHDETAEEHAEPLQPQLHNMKLGVFFEQRSPFTPLAMFRLSLNSVDLNSVVPVWSF